MDGFGWDNILVGLLSLISIAVAAREARKSKERDARAKEAQLEIGRQKVDAEAYTRAQEITGRAITRLEGDIERLESDLKEARADIVTAREERDRERELNLFYRRRLRMLEDALRDSGIPVPEEEPNGKRQQ